jgi:membrane protein DedA with SNARE-associated domain
VTAFVRDYGLVIVFLTVGLETAGVPLPGETALLAAAVLASQGHFAIGWVIVVASVAAILGDNVGYWLGRTLGRSFLQRYALVRRFSDRVLPSAERFFQRHGGKAIFFARWFSGFRIAGAWLAGFAHMPWWRFFLWNAAGGIAWAVSMSLVAYYAGRAAGEAITRYGLVAAGVLGVVVLAAAAGVHLWRRRFVTES